MAAANTQAGGLAHAQADLQRAIISTQQNAFKMEETALIFETQKKHDIQKFMVDYLNSIMQFHANALECLAECKPLIEKIDVESDMVWFRQGLRLPQMGTYGGMGNAMYGNNMMQVPGMQN